MTLPMAWIVDVDGTLALRADRNPYDWRGAAADQPNKPVVTVVQALAAHPKVDSIIAVSGRPEQARSLTEKWLAAHDVPFDALLLRASDDNRADDIVKEDIFRSVVAPHYSVMGVIDDRAKVVRMWRRIGLTCLQVAEGNF
ncbi:MAG: hypothetical protein WA988_04380 [Candidatus Nanopelagicales bacterium]